MVNTVFRILAQVEKSGMDRKNSVFVRQKKYFTMENAFLQKLHVATVKFGILKFMLANALLDIGTMELSAFKRKIVRKTKYLTLY